VIIKYLQNIQWAMNKSMNRSHDPILSPDLESRMAEERAEKEKQIRNRLDGIIQRLRERHENENRKIEDEINSRKTELHKTSEIVRIHEQKMAGFYRSLEEHIRRFEELRENLRAGLESSSAELNKAAELVTTLESLETQRNRTVKEVVSRFGIDSLPLEPSSRLVELKNDIKRWLDEVRCMQKILVPIKKVAGEPALLPMEENAPNENPPALKKRILIIDKDAADVEIIGYFLKEKDYDIRIANDPFSGLELAGEYHPELILLDSEMISVNGADIFGNKKNRETPTDIPVILTGSLSKKEQMETALKTGALGYITKPYSIRDLQQKVEEILGQQADVLPDSSAATAGADTSTTSSS